MCLVNLVDPEHGNETYKISDSGKERELLQPFESDVNLNMIPNCEIDIVRDMDPYVVWPQQLKAVHVGRSGSHFQYRTDYTHHSKYPTSMGHKWGFCVL